MQNQNPLGPPPENHLVWAILATCLCCIPLGVVSILKANKVESLWAQGDAIGAQKAADDAKKYAIWSAIIVPLCFIVFYAFAFIISIAGALLGA